MISIHQYISASARCEFSALQVQSDGSLWKFQRLRLWKPWKNFEAQNTNIRSHYYQKTTTIESPPNHKTPHHHHKAPTTPFKYHYHHHQPTMWLAILLLFIMSFIFKFTFSFAGYKGALKQNLIRWFDMSGI